MSLLYFGERFSLVEVLKGENVPLIDDHIVQEILQYFPVMQLQPTLEQGVNVIQSGVKAYST